MFGLGPLRSFNCGVVRFCWHQGFDATFATMVRLVHSPKAHTKWHKVTLIVLISTRVITIAVVCQLLAAAYLQLVEWVDLFPWNDLSKGNQQEVLDVVLLGSQALVAFWFARRWLVLMVVGWAAYAYWLYLQIVSWWQPYLFGGRTVGPHWYFARTLKILPAIEGRPTPDANHMLLQLLLVAVLVSGAMAIWQTYAARRQARRAAM